MNYDTFKNSKELLVQSFLETIDFIKNYIKETPVKFNFQITEYDPEIFFKKIGYVQAKYENIE